MYNLIGFTLILGILYTVRNILGVSIDFYFDEVALLIVLGGTLATTVISFPPLYLKKLFFAPFAMLKSGRPNTIESIDVLVRASSKEGASKASVRPLLKNKKIDPFLKEGIELLLLGLERQEFKSILTERIYRARQREEEIVTLFRRLAKYPPAFGLVGTVLGLVNLMRSVGAGADAAQIGLNMALALTATLYGLGFSNFVLAPISEHFLQKAEDQKVFRELLLEGLLMIHDQKSALTVQEMLNSYLDPKQRIDILGIHYNESA